MRKKPHSQALAKLPRSTGAFRAAARLLPRRRPGRQTPACLARESLSRLLLFRWSFHPRQPNLLGKRKRGNGRSDTVHNADRFNGNIDAGLNGRVVPMVAVV